MNANDSGDAMDSSEEKRPMVDMSPEAIDARLKMVDKLRRLRGDPKHPDMSPEAIAARLEAVDELRRLCMPLCATGRSSGDST
jgi:hypothetical protein